MTQTLERPAGGETGRALDYLVWQQDASDYNPLRNKYNFRLSHLWRRHGLSGFRAELIAALAFDGGAR